MMRRPWLVWLCFSLCLAVALAALGLLSVRVWHLDRAEALATAQASLEENARLALWRMDSALSALVAQESARPAVGYASADDPRDPLAPASGPAAALTDGGSVVLHFEVDDAGTWRSGNASMPPTVAANEGVTSKSYLDAAAAFAQIQREARFADLAAALPAGDILPIEMADEIQVAQTEQPAQLQQSARNRSEFRARSQAVAQTANAQQRVLNNNSVEVVPTAAAPKVGAMTPLWLSEHLLLARRANTPGRTLLQGCLLDWRAIRTTLVESIRDLFPTADLAPAPGAAESEGARLLAALPVRLIVPPAAAAAGEGMTPMRWSLLAAWTSLFVAAAAAAVVLGGVLALSERRAAFVSAVTHELRTPLTTFRMYAEMLSEGMVSSESDRRRYLDTLRVEADRLTHLVENVLAYARLERGGLGGRKRPIRVDELLAASGERLQARAVQAQLDLQVTLPEDLAGATAVADPGAVEQVLFNLVDNACKYAAGATDRRVHLDIRRANGHIELCVRDHGPGISTSQQRVLFQPFRKSAEEAAVSAPGVGLGLALSRRLAVQMGGRLALDERPQGGACFVLALPLSASADPPNHS